MTERLGAKRVSTATAATKTVWLLWKQTTLYGSAWTTREDVRNGSMPGWSDDDDTPALVRVRVDVPVHAESLVGVYCDDPLAGRVNTLGYRSQQVEVYESDRAYLGEGI